MESKAHRIDSVHFFFLSSFPFFLFVCKLKAVVEIVQNRFMFSNYYYYRSLIFHFDYFRKPDFIYDEFEHSELAT